MYFQVTQILDGHTRTDDLMSDYCDGGAFKEYPLLSKDPKALQILILYDDMEFVNPLGSYTKGIVEKPGPWTLDWTVDWTLDWTDNVRTRACVTAHTISTCLLIGY